MRRECRERFPRHRLQRKPLVSDPDMHHGTCVTHVPWCMSVSLNAVVGENVPGIPGACATRNFTYLARGPWWTKIYGCNRMKSWHGHTCRIDALCAAQKANDPELCPFVDASLNTVLNEQLWMKWDSCYLTPMWRYSHMWDKIKSSANNRLVGNMSSWKNIESMFFILSKATSAHINPIVGQRNKAPPWPPTAPCHVRLILCHGSEFWRFQHANRLSQEGP